MKKIEKPEDMTFILTSKTSPLSFIIPSRSTKARQLLWWDEEKGINRAIRYAKNQRSIFEDEQDGHAIIEPIVMEDGMIVAPKTDPNLQKFLMYHPDFGKTWKLSNKTLDAQEELARLDMMDEASAEAKTLSISEARAILRVLVDARSGNNEDEVVVMRDVRNYARKNPKEFLAMRANPDLDVMDTVNKAISKGILKTRANDTQLWWNTDSKTKIIDIPMGVKLEEYVGAHLKTDDGLPVLEMLISLLK